MIDLAASAMNKGVSLASERIVSINDNMDGSHYHTYYELYYLESGERYHLIDNNIHHVTANQFLIFEPYVLHSSYGDQNKPFSRILIYFRKDIVESLNILQGLEHCTGIYKFPPTGNNALYSLMANILDAYNQPGEYNSEYLKSLLNLLLITLLKNKKYRSNDNYKNTITDIITYINENYHSQITLDLLSKKFYVSKEHLCREFKHYTSTTIIRYINSVRIINAQKIMNNHDKSITAIGLDVGFSNITHFGRVFKENTGCTPTQYRKNLF